MVQVLLDRHLFRVLSILTFSFKLTGSNFNFNFRWSYLTIEFETTATSFYFFFLSIIRAHGGTKKIEIKSRTKSSKFSTVGFRTNAAGSVVEVLKLFFFSFVDEGGTK